MKHLKPYKICKLLSLSLLLATAAGCTSLGYYAQSIAGQFEISNSQRPIIEVLENDELPEVTRDQLRMVQEIRLFASEELGLPDNNSYHDYADLGRDYVVWNIFAAPELSLKPLEWCYLLVGCLNYRGYFSKEDTLQHAKQLQEQNFDVFTGGVAAYSTLGWFDDPVLNTMLQWNSTYVAELIFHELAHQVLYIKNDTKFNEAFADTVAFAGVKSWLAKHGTAATQQAYDINRRQEDAFLSLVFNYRDKLDRLYQSDTTDAHKRKEKARLLNEMTTAYGVLSENWENSNRYDAWFEQVNNASLLAVITYRDYLPGFTALLEHNGNKLPEFYKLVEQLGQCPKEMRQRILAEQQTIFDC